MMQPPSARGGPACAFCAEIVVESAPTAWIALPSRAHGQRYFAAHASCFQHRMSPEVAQFLDLDDVPPARGLPPTAPPA